jgi:hypothetical protein
MLSKEQGLHEADQLKNTELVDHSSLALPNPSHMLRVLQDEKSDRAREKNAYHQILKVFSKRERIFLHALQTRSEHTSFDIIAL